MTGEHLPKGRPNPWPSGASWPTAPTCRSSGSIGSRSPPPSAPAAGRAPGPSPPTTRTPPRSGSRRPAGRCGRCRPARPGRPPSTSPPPTRPTWRRPTPPPSTPPSASTRRWWPTTSAGRSAAGSGALRAALERAEPTLVVLSDVRTGLPGGADEAAGGDGAVAFVTAGAGRPGARGAPMIGRTGGRRRRHRGAPRPVAPPRRADRPAVGGALRRGDPGRAGPGGPDRRPEAGRASSPASSTPSAVSGTSPRAARKVAGALGGAGATRGRRPVGHGRLHRRRPRRAAAGLGPRQRPQAGAVIASLSLADGADALVFRATDALAAGRPTPSLADQIAAGGAPLPYPTFLTWRGMLRREPPRRPDPVRPTAPASHRGEAWKYGFSASPVPGLQPAPPAAPAGLPGVPRRRPDGARAPGRRARHDRHLHPRPPGLLAAPAGGGGGGRLRRRRPVPVRADRRRPRHAWPSASGWR